MVIEDRRADTGAQCEACFQRGIADGDDGIVVRRETLMDLETELPAAGRTHAAARRGIRSARTGIILCQCDGRACERKSDRGAGDEGSERSLHSERGKDIKLV
jgi:hypothetical protein